MQKMNLVFLMSALCIVLPAYCSEGAQTSQKPASVVGASGVSKVEGTVPLAAVVVTIKDDEKKTDKDEKNLAGAQDPIDPSFINFGGMMQ
jgi:hypothetical protein